MRKFLNIFIIFTLFTLSACDQIGSSRIKNLVDLTPPLQVEDTSPVIFKDARDEVAADESARYTLSKKTVIAKPAVAKKVFYSLEESGFLNAFSLKENKTLWRTDVRGARYERHFIDGGVLYSNGKLYVTNGTRYLIVVDAETGIEEFRKEFSDLIRVKPVMTAKEDLLIQTVDNKLYSVNSNDFQVKWVHEGGLQNINISNYIHPTIFKEHIIVSYTNGDVFCLDLATGNGKWRYRLAGRDDIGMPEFVPTTIQTQPVIDGNFMYFATSKNKLIKFNIYSGSPSWTRDAHDVQTLSMHEKYLLLTNNARQVAVIDSDSSKVLWLGNLISEEDKAKRKRKTAKFMDPFVTKYNDRFSINVAANNGEFYKFTSGQDVINTEYSEAVNDDADQNQATEQMQLDPLSSRDFPVWPVIESIYKGAAYQWFSCCDGSHYVIADKYLVRN